MEKTDSELIAAVLKGDTASFEPLVVKYSPRVFATVRRYSRKESEVEDIAQEVWMRAFQKLSTFRGEAPFEHWLLRMTVRVCYDSLRTHRRKREAVFSDLSDDEHDWLDHFVTDSTEARENASAAKELLSKVLDRLPAHARLVVTLMEIEERSVKEVAELTGWSTALVKVRAFRARAEMRKVLGLLSKEKY